MAKSQIRIQARTLRATGESLKQIAKNLHVSSSSVSVWCRDIVFSKEQQQLMRKRGYIMGSAARLQAIKNRKLVLDKSINAIHQNAQSEVGKLTKRDIFIAGIALYWGEGFKKDHLVGLATTSLGIARFYIRWLQTCFHISTEQLILRVTINSEKKLLTTDIGAYWSKHLHIPLSQFSQPYYQVAKWKKIYDHPENYHGVLRIKVRKSISLLRKIEGYIQAFEAST